MGRPDGRKQAKFSLAPVATELESVLGKSVKFIEDCVSDVALAATADPGNILFEKKIISLNLVVGSVILLENVRFCAEEEGKGVKEDGSKFKPESDAVTLFREKLSKHGDVYVNDAFGCAHRAHSSVVGIQHQQR